jgi:hypothetical protein
MLGRPVRCVLWRMIMVFGVWRHQPWWRTFLERWLMICSLLKGICIRKNNSGPGLPYLSTGHWRHCPYLKVMSVFYGGVARVWVKIQKLAIGATDGKGLLHSQWQGLSGWGAMTWCLDASSQPLANWYRWQEEWMVISTAWRKLLSSKLEVSRVWCIDGLPPPPHVLIRKLIGTLP